MERLITPAFVNAHSHAFQRALRGRTEFRARDTGDFWSWREAMYAVAAELTPEQLHLVARHAYLEMALSGISTVIEFHYLHHQPDGSPYRDVHAMAHALVQAARDVGIRLVLLRTAYARAGFEQPLHPVQRRFCDADMETALRHTEDLAHQYRADSTVAVGLALHSVRALPREWLEVAARHWKGAVHMHVSEQHAEVEACIAEHRRRPLELLAELGLLSPSFTAVHAIHVTPEEVSLLAAAGAQVCVCPTTERSLGDGLAPTLELFRAQVPLCLGTDSHVQIDMLEEMRGLEMLARLKHGGRALLHVAPESPNQLADGLLEMASVHGLRTLGPDANAWEQAGGKDEALWSLSHPSLSGAHPDSARAALVFGGRVDALEELWVNQRRVVAEGQHVTLGAAQRVLRSR